MQYVTGIAGGNTRRLRSRYLYTSDAKKPSSLERREQSQNRTTPTLGICSSRDRLLIFDTDHHDDRTLDLSHALFPTLVLALDCDFFFCHSLLPSA